MKLVRFDRHILNNLGWLRDTYEKDEMLVLHVLIFVAYDLQYNFCAETLFGTRIWDPHLVSSKIGFSHKTLINKVNVEQRRELMNIPPSNWKQYDESRVAAGRPLWDSALDNALYILLQQSRIDVTDADRNGDKGSGLRKVQVFDEVTKYYKGASRKIYYELRYSDSFVTSLSRYFSRFDLDLLMLLPPACRILYLSLMNLRDMTSHSSQQTKKIVMYPTIDSLFRLANTKQKSQAENMRELKSKLGTINDVAAHVLKRGPDSRPYIDAVFHDFQPIVTIEYSDEELQQLEADNKDRFKKVLLLNLKSCFRKSQATKIKAMVSSLEFHKLLHYWLLNLDIDLEPKMRALEDTYLMVYGNTTYYEVNRWKQYKEIIPTLSEVIRPEQFSTSLA